MQRYQPTANNPKSSGTEGFQRAIGKPFGRLRRGETPACGKDPLWLERPAGRSRPFGATMCKWLIKRREGRSCGSAKLQLLR